MTTGEELKAAIDLGSNSFRLLIGARDLSPAPVRETVTVGLGEGLCRGGGRIDRAAFARGLAAIEGFKATLDRFAIPPGKIRVCGTEALRRAGNSGAFIEQASRIIGRRIEIISGEEEAALSLTGVLSGLHDTAPPLLVADIGAASTELIITDRPPEIDRRSSLPLGAAVISQVIKTAGRVAARERIEQAIAPALAGITGNPSLILVGGSATTCAAIDLALEPYSPEPVQGHEIDRDRFLALCDRILAADEKGLAEMKGLAPDRAGIIGGGVLICLAIMEKVPARSATVSDLGLLEGIFLSIP